MAGRSRVRAVGTGRLLPCTGSRSNREVRTTMATTLEAELREETGKGAGRRLRATGRVPGILYGHAMEPIKLSISGQDLLHLFHASGGASMVLDLKVDGKTHLAIRRDEMITLAVEVHAVGEAPGVKAGGVIEHHLRDVEVECLPSNVPEGIQLDVSELEIGDMLRVSDIVAPEGVTVLTDPATPVISVITPAALRTEADLTLPGEEAPEAA